MDLIIHSHPHHSSHSSSHYHPSSLPLSYILNPHPIISQDNRTSSHHPHHTLIPLLITYRYPCNHSNRSHHSLITLNDLCIIIHHTLQSPSITHINHSQHPHHIPTSHPNITIIILITHLPHPSSPTLQQLNHLNIGPNSSQHPHHPIVTLLNTQRGPHHSHSPISTHPIIIHSS